MNENPWNISYQNPDWKNKIEDILLEYGLVVINDVYSFDECDSTMEELIECFHKINSNVIYNNGQLSWEKKDLPPETRDGMYQRLVSNLPILYKYRSDPKLHEIYSLAYSKIREREINEFISSIDGLNLRPPIEPFYKETDDDWAHLDQESTEKYIYKYIQGQIVISDSRGCFRASPKSHLLFNEIHQMNIELSHKYSELDYQKRSELIENQIREKIKNIGGEYQIPIRTTKGSIILWFSSLIHSSMTQDEKFNLLEYPHKINSKWANWRCVLYITLQPKDEVTKKQILNIKRASRTNRTTNHSAEKIFSDYVDDYNPSNYSSVIADYVEKPEDIYKISGLNPQIDENITKKILGG